MDHKLSIIMPCYNCAKTLEEALASVYTQGLQIPFEVVMVDDGSTDGTWKLMQSLSQKYPHVRLLQHEKNRGGGAARNTAVEKSVGDIIFCLDSDDILPPEMLPKMIDCLEEKQCDGVVFEKTQYFVKQPTVPVFVKESVIDVDYNKTVELDDLFWRNSGYLTLVNFLYTKQAFYTAGGYPVHHGFDTQGFGYRFLSSGSKSYICPKSFYYHRQAAENKSYFERVYESGKYSVNTYLILEEIIYLLSPEIRKFIAFYNIFDNNQLGENNLKAAVDVLYKQDSKHFFIENYEKYLYPQGFEQFYNEFHNSQLPEDVFAIAVYEYLHNQYAEAEQHYGKLKATGWKSRIIDYNLERVKFVREGKVAKTSIEAVILENHQDFSLRRRKMNWQKNPIYKVINRMPKLKQFIKKYLIYKFLHEKL